VFAVGDNAEAARLTGTNKRRLLLGVYATAGFVYGSAALIVLVRTQRGRPNDRRPRLDHRGRHQGHLPEVFQVAYRIRVLRRGQPAGVALPGRDAPDHWSG
jgi:hypothetical protein